MDAGDAALGLYQIVNPKWSFVVSCDWQCRPQDEQTTMMAEHPEEAGVLQSQTLDEKDAQLGLYQIVDPRWFFAVTCDWQCRPEDDRRTTVTGVQPTRPSLQEGQEFRPQEAAPQLPARTKCNVPLSEADARLGLYQMVDHRWNYVISCDWMCKPPRGRKSAARGSKARESSLRQRGTSKVHGKETGSVPLSEAEARLGLYQRVSPQWEHVISCDWQCRPEGEPAPESGAVPLSESDARLGLYQLVSPRWSFWISCDWQCRPEGEADDDMVETGEVMASESGVFGPPEPAAAPLPESDARLGLYQQVSPRWSFWISCDWQCRLEGEAADADERVGRHKKSGYGMEEGAYSTSSLSTCREEDGIRGTAVYMQTGDIMIGLVGDEGEYGMVEIDEEGSSVDHRLSPDIAEDEKAAERRKRELAQLVRELGEDVCSY